MHPAWLLFAWASCGGQAVIDSEPAGSPCEAWCDGLTALPCAKQNRVECMADCEQAFGPNVPCGDRSAAYSACLAESDILYCDARGEVAYREDETRCQVERRALEKTVCHPVCHPPNCPGE